MVLYTSLQSRSFLLGCEDHRESGGIGWKGPLEASDRSLRAAKRVLTLKRCRQGQTEVPSA